MMRGFLNWLFDRRCSCDELRERVSLAERSERLLVDLVHAERVDRIRWKEVAERITDELEALAETALAVQQECDGLMRELWLERRRNQDLREELAKPRIFQVSLPLQSDSIHRALLPAQPEGSNAGGES